MTTPRRIPQSRRWSTKQYILAALLAMLATVAVVASISISLAPAHIAFFVQDASITNNTDKRTQDGKELLNLTLVANNPRRHRTEVSYGSLAVEIWWSETGWIPTEEVDTSAALPGWLPPGSTTLVKVGVEWGQFDETTTPMANNGAPPPPPPTAPQGGGNAAMNSGVANWPDCRVVVEAKVRFRFAGVPTLPYTVRVSCFPVNFWEGTRGPVNCTG